MIFTNILKEEIKYRYYLSEQHEMTYSHAHSNFELYFCPDKRKQKSVINGNEYTYDFPCVIISNPYTIHSMSSAEEGIYNRIVVHFGEHTLSQFGDSISHRDFLTKASGYLFKLTEEQSRTLMSILANTAKKGTSVSQNERALILMLFINKLIELCDEESITAVGTSDMYIQEVLKYIIENISSDLNTSDIAAHFAVSRSKLDRDFIRVSGYPTHTFIESYRLNRAKELLTLSKKLSIGEISEMCGFKSNTYFYSFFRKHTGMTPLKYRKSVSEKK
ncbi:MAG: helix-turn-helix transcriptional regulator [Clostridia bacterium]|nr:helix-turn-helix transcriptional regulator [Clostridia bacterium]